MTETEVFEMAKEVGLPTVYHHFEEGCAPEPPYLIYLFPNSENFGADNGVYMDISRVNFELYTDKKDTKLERKVQAVLKKHGVFYEKDESYLETEHMYEVLYEMGAIINGEE